MGGREGEREREREKWREVTKEGRLCLCVSGYESEGARYRRKRRGSSPVTCTVHTDKTSGISRLNSSKHPHEPEEARPLKMLPSPR